VVYERSLFVKTFTVLLLVLMSVMSIYLLTLALDHVIVRPRQLQPDKVSYSVGKAVLHACSTMLPCVQPQVAHAATAALLTQVSTVLL
jgi:hypothetical protein